MGRSLPASTLLAWAVFAVVLAAHAADASFTSTGGYLTVAPVQAFVVAQSGCLQLCESRAWCRAASTGTDGACRLFDVPIAAGARTPSAAWVTFEKESFVSPCPPAFFYDLQVGACAAVQQCAPGFFVSQPASIVNNTVCAACRPGTFQPLAGQTACLPVRAPCPSNFVERAAPTASSDRRCEGPMLRVSFALDLPHTQSEVLASAPAALAAMLGVTSGLSFDEAQRAVSFIVRASPATNTTTVTANLTVREAHAVPLWTALCNNRLFYPAPSPASSPFSVPSGRVTPSCEAAVTDAVAFAAASPSSTAGGEGGGAAVAAIGAVLGVVLLVLIVGGLAVLHRRRRSVSCTLEAPPHSLRTHAAGVPYQGPVLLVNDERHGTHMTQAATQPRNSSIVDEPLFATKPVQESPGDERCSPLLRLNDDRRRSKVSSVTRAPGYQPSPHPSVSGSAGPVINEPASEARTSVVGVCGFGPAGSAHSSRRPTQSSFGPALCGEHGSNTHIVSPLGPSTPGPVSSLTAAAAAQASLGRRRTGDRRGPGMASGAELLGPEGTIVSNVHRSSLAQGSGLTTTAAAAAAAAAAAGNSHTHLHPASKNASLSRDGSLRTGPGASDVTGGAGMYSSQVPSSVFSAAAAANGSFQHTASHSHSAAHAAAQSGGPGAMQTLAAGTNHSSLAALPDFTHVPRNQTWSRSELSMHAHPGQAATDTMTSSSLFNMDIRAAGGQTAWRRSSLPTDPADASEPIFGTAPAVTGLSAGGLTSTSAATGAACMMNTNTLAVVNNDNLAAISAAASMFAAPSTPSNAAALAAPGPDGSPANTSPTRSAFRRIVSDRAGPSSSTRTGAAEKHAWRRSVGAMPTGRPLSFADFLVSDTPSNAGAGASDSMQPLTTSTSTGPAGGAQTQSGPATARASIATPATGTATGADGTTAHTNGANTERRPGLQQIEELSENTSPRSLAAGTAKLGQQGVPSSPSAALHTSGTPASGAQATVPAAHTATTVPPAQVTTTAAATAGGVGGGSNGLNSSRPGSGRRTRRPSLLGNSCTNAADIPPSPIPGEDTQQSHPAHTQQAHTGTHVNTHVNARTVPEEESQHDDSAVKPSGLVLVNGHTALPTATNSNTAGGPASGQTPHVVRGADAHVDGAGVQQVTSGSAVESPTQAATSGPGITASALAAAAASFSKDSEPLTPGPSGLPARMIAPCTVPPPGAPDGTVADSPVEMRSPEWVYKDVSRAEACAILLEPPWAGQAGCYLVRRKMEMNTYVISLVGRQQQVAHYLLERGPDHWIVQSLTDRPVAPASTPLKAVLSTLREPDGRWRMNLQRMVHPLSPAEL